MNRILLVVAFVIAIAHSTFAQDPGTAVTPGTLVWCGLDYSHVKMIGTQDFKNADAIFPSMLESWNGLFMKEMLPKLEKMAPGAATDINAIQPGNAKAGGSAIVREDGTEAEMVTPTHITAQDIATIVKSYKIRHTQGLGLVFIVDRLVKSQQTGCLYVVFFDIATRKVVYSQRCCEKASGAGFRNYWFGPIKKTVKDLPGMYRQAKTGK